MDLYSGYPKQAGRHRIIYEWNHGDQIVTSKEVYIPMKREPPPPPSWLWGSIDLGDECYVLPYPKSVSENDAVLILEYNHGKPLADTSLGDTDEKNTNESQDADLTANVLQAKDLQFKKESSRNKSNRNIRGVKRSAESQDLERLLGKKSLSGIVGVSCKEYAKPLNRTNETIGFHGMYPPQSVCGNVHQATTELESTDEIIVDVDPSMVLKIEPIDEVSEDEEKMGSN